MRRGGLGRAARGPSGQQRLAATGIGCQCSITTYANPRLRVMRYAVVSSFTFSFTYIQVLLRGPDLRALRPRDV